MKDLLLPRFYVLVQLLSLLYFMLSAPVVASSYEALFIEAAGLALGIIAILQMKPGNFNITPVPRQNGILISHGIYRIIRHPMYLAQLLVVLALVIDYFSWIRLAVFMLLLINLIFKLHYEERKLIRHFDGYAAYSAKNWKLIPYIF
ncbi:MAG: DUF1295 domain-containing protein [Bacteroidetes bacterium]|nr:DUF1295 domain-containing protein [Bacteroidota bacterium]MBU1578404.1 DUF1295 domain-containing protein [Bacteroidota bacterium]MBU2556683.1 DUF1295 domain-containing protein [Bacteroidota bacterium]